MKYMVNHNASHTKELSEIAQKLGEKRCKAYDFVKEAISLAHLMNKANMDCGTGNFIDICSEAEELCKSDFNK